MLELPCTLNGLEATPHLQELFSDVTKREMVLHARATINGDIAVLRYRHHFEVYIIAYLGLFAWVCNPPIDSGLCLCECTHVFVCFLTRAVPCAQVYLQSEIVVDPVFLDVIDQHHRADLDIEGVDVTKVMDK